MFSDGELLVCRCQARLKVVALSSEMEEAGHEVREGGAGEGAGGGT